MVSTTASGRATEGWAETSAGGDPTSRQGHILWFRQPSSKWFEALPLGNGRLGATVFSGVQQERITLNEDPLWSGYPRQWFIAVGLQKLAVGRHDVLKQKDYQAADKDCYALEGLFNES